MIGIGLYSSSRAFMAKGFKFQGGLRSVGFRLRGFKGQGFGTGSLEGRAAHCYGRVMHGTFEG